MRTTILAGLCSLLTLFSSPVKGTLPEITKPYLGTYECKRLSLGSRDLLKELQDIRLELVDEARYALFYKEKGEVRKKVEGNYSYDERRGVLIFTTPQGMTQEVPLEKGTLTLSLPVAGKRLVVTFEQK